MCAFRHAIAKAAGHLAGFQYYTNAVTGSGEIRSTTASVRRQHLTLPLLTLSGGLPLGVQAVGRRHDDARLLRSARWLVREFADRSMA